MGLSKRRVSVSVSGIDISATFLAPLLIRARQGQLALVVSQGNPALRNKHTPIEYVLCHQTRRTISVECAAGSASVRATFEVAVVAKYLEFCKSQDRRPIIMSQILSV